MEKSLEDMSAERLVKRYEELLLLVPILEKYKAEILRRLEAGEEVPGYDLVPGNAIRVWENMTKIKKFLKRLGYTEDEYAPRTFLTVSQMEKLVSPAKLKPFVAKLPGNKRMAKS